jgi:hypothetical protein
VQKLDPQLAKAQLEVAAMRAGGSTGGSASGPMAMLQRWWQKLLAVLK